MPNLSRLPQNKMLRIGQVLKSNGSDGELLLSFFEIGPEDIDLQEPVFVYCDGLPVPFYFESFTPRGNRRALARLTGVRSLRDAEELAGAAIYADYFEEEDSEDLSGWTLCHEDGSPFGLIEGLEDIPGNPCLEVSTPDGTSVLVPLHEDLVTESDPKARRICMRIPEGLLSL